MPEKSAMDNIWAIIKSQSSNLYMYKTFYEKKTSIKSMSMDIVPYRFN
jgi:hypothetical protein